MVPGMAEVSINALSVGGEVTLLKAAPGSTLRAHMEQMPLFSGRTILHIRRLSRFARKVTNVRNVGVPV